MKPSNHAHVKSIAFWDQIMTIEYIVLGIDVRNTFLRYVPNGNCTKMFEIGPMQICPAGFDQITIVLAKCISYMQIEVM